MLKVKTLIKYIFLFTSVLFSNDVNACLSASQNRIFPLGISSSNLFVIEFQLYRFELIDKVNEKPKIKTVWGGDCYFKVYDENYKEIHSELIEHLKSFKEENYISTIENSFIKGKRISEQRFFYKRINQESIFFCDYQENCKKANLVFDTTLNKINIKLQNGFEKELCILDDSTTFGSNLIGYLKGFDEMEISAKSLKDNIAINSVRVYNFDERKLTIVHIANGYSNKLEEKKNPKINFKEEINFAFFERVMHHGNGFDFFILE